MEVPQRSGVSTPGPWGSRQGVGRMPQCGHAPTLSGCGLQKRYQLSVNLLGAVSRCYQPSASAASRTNLHASAFAGPMRSYYR